MDKRTNKTINQNENQVVTTAELVELEFEAGVNTAISSNTVELDKNAFDSSKEDNV